MTMSQVEEEDSFQSSWFACLLKQFSRRDGRNKGLSNF